MLAQSSDRGLHQIRRPDFASLGQHEVQAVGVADLYGDVEFMPPKVEILHRNCEQRGSPPISPATTSAPRALRFGGVASFLRYGQWPPSRAMWVLPVDGEGADVRPTYCPMAWPGGYCLLPGRSVGIWR